MKYQNFMRPLQIKISQTVRFDLIRNMNIINITSKHVRDVYYEITIIFNLSHDATLLCMATKRMLLRKYMGVKIK